MSISDKAPSDTAPLVVKPREARCMLACGNTRLYELLAAKELESFLDGRSRKITVESIRRYIARRLAPTVSPTKDREPRRRGWPRKTAHAARANAT
jgi:hypothetical protein